MPNKINYILLLVIGCVLFLGSCKQDTMPEDLAGMKKYLSAKKQALKELEASISEVTKEIEKLEPPKEKDPIEVEAINLQPQEFKRYIEIQAQIAADDVVNASSAIGGRIISLGVKEGQSVRKGQVIATTDMTTLETQISEIETSLSLATTVYERQNKLWQQNIGSEMQYLEAKNNKERIEKSLETLKSQISKKYVYAPISGIVDMQFLKQGETAGPGMPIVQIMNTSKVKIVADLQESLLGSIKKGDDVEVYFPALDKTTKNKITMIGRTIDPANRTFKVEMNTSSLSGQLKPNLMAQAKFNDYTEKDAVIIPINTVQDDVNGNKYVYIIKEEGGKSIAKKVLIELGESNGETAIVLVGLQSGDQLITEGSKNITDNDVINPTIKSYGAEG